MQPLPFQLTTASGISVSIQATWIALAQGQSPSQPLAEQGHVYGVYQSALSTRSVARDDHRVSHTTMARILKEVAACAGVTLTREGCGMRRINVETLMTNPSQDTIRAVCFPQGKRGHTHETIIPAVYFPLVVARMGRKLRESASTAAFERFLARWCSYALGAPTLGESGIVHQRLFQFVTTFSVNWGPVAPHEEYEYEEDAQPPPGSPMDDGSLCFHFDKFGRNEASVVMLEMMHRQRWAATVTCDALVGDVSSVLSGVENIPGHPLEISVHVEEPGL